MKATHGSLVKKGEADNITQEIQLETIVTAPIEKGQILGSVVYSLNGEELGRTSLIAESSVKRLSYFNSTSLVLWKWFSLFRL